MSLRDSSLPFVSVIIPAYNGARTINRAIESILKQTYTRHEVIIVDDGSTDSTPAILRQYKSQYGSRFKITTQENRGCLAARESGIKRADGDYIAFLDQDDWWIPKKLAIQVAIMQKNPQVGLTFGNLAAIDTNGKSLGFMVNRRGECHSPSWEELLCIFPLYPSSSLIRTGLFDTVRYDLRFGLSGAYGDQDFHVRLRGVTDFHFYNGKLGAYCWHVDSEGAEMFLDNLTYYAEKYWNHKNLSLEAYQLVREKFVLAIEGEVRHLFRRLLKEQKNVASTNWLNRFIQYNERMSQILHPDYLKIAGHARFNLATFHIDDSTVSTLLFVYLCRPDLQELFPEVYNGELNRLLNYASMVAMGSRSDYDEAILKQFKAQLEILSKESAIQSEVTAIRRSLIYRLLRWCSTVLDKLMPDLTRRGNITRLTIASLHFIEQNGFKAFCRETFRRIRARFFGTNNF